MKDQLILENQLCFRLYRASRMMTRIYQPILDELGITYPQYITMMVMWQKENIDFKELGHKLDLKTGTLTPIIKKLENLGFLYREKNESDNRKVWVNITNKGSELKEKSAAIPETLMKYFNMDMEEYNRYISTLDQITDVLKRAEDKQKKR